MQRAEGERGGGEVCPGGGGQSVCWRTFSRSPSLHLQSTPAGAFLRKCFPGWCTRGLGSDEDAVGHLSTFPIAQHMRTAEGLVKKHLELSGLAPVFFFCGPWGSCRVDICLWPLHPRWPCLPSPIFVLVILVGMCF